MLSFTIMTSIDILLMLVYILIIILAYGVPNSLSESYYLLPKKMRFIFTVVMLYHSLFLMISVFPTINDIYTLILISISAFGLILVGMMPSFKDKYQKILHFFGALLAGGTSLVWMIIMGYWYIPMITYLIFFFISAIFYHFRKMTFFIEMGAFLPMYIIIMILKICQL